MGTKRRIDSRPAPDAVVRGVLLALAVSLLLSGCGSAPNPPPTGGSASPAAPGGRTATPAPSAATSSGPTLPGTREFGLTDEEFAQHVEKTQALIASCMADAGFEYLPVNVQTVEAAQARVRQDPGYTRRPTRRGGGSR